MLSFVPFIFVLNFIGPLSALQDNDSSICLLTDAPNQCGAFCLSALHPLIDDNFHSQVKLDRIEQGVESLKNASEGHFGSVNSQIKNEFQSLLTKMEISMLIDGQLLEVYKKLEARLNGTEGQLRMFESKMEAQLLELKNQLSAFQKTLLEIPSTIYYKIKYPKFELIGSRYFYIEHYIKKTWDEAAETCREMGGYLAAFENPEELTAVMSKFFRWSYWTGIKRLKEDGEYISTASGKPATVFKAPFSFGGSDIGGPCVLLRGVGMFEFPCNDEKYFICQSDNET
ncbi:accessory gland protein Acp29AB-like [Drosophila takahashii]|uniref:accessory gland protein Acp29AB-like n=1 Tax=Drosophila takahashii TaxID=29030 RepID=UPI001CF83135|nr:accessory gland protein Acp29AB-like [Drosophila takahashii]